MMYEASLMARFCADVATFLSVPTVMAWEEKIGLIIESKKIFTTLKSVFEMNWLGLK